MDINVVPHIIETTVSKLRIDNASVKLFENVSFFVRLFDAEDNLVGGKTVTLTNEEYNEWTDDNAIVDLILQKLGMSKA